MAENGTWTPPADDPNATPPPGVVVDGDDSEINWEDPAVKAVLDAKIKEATAKLEAKNHELIGERRKDGDKIKAMEATIEAYGENKPDDVSRIAEELEALKSAGDDDGKKTDEIVNQLRSEHERKLQKAMDLVADKDTKIDMLESNIDSRELNAAMHDGMVAAGVEPKYYKFMAHEHLHRFKVDRLEDNNRKIECRTSDGESLYTDKGEGKPKDVFQSLKETPEWESYFVGNTNNGTGPPDGQRAPSKTDNPWKAGKSFNISQQMQIQNDNPTAAAELKRQAGAV